MSHVSSEPSRPGRGRGRCGGLAGIGEQRGRGPGTGEAAAGVAGVKRRPTGHQPKSRGEAHAPGDRRCGAQTRRAVLPALSRKDSENGGPGTPSHGETCQPLQ